MLATVNTLYLAPLLFILATLLYYWICEEEEEVFTALPRAYTIERYEEIEAAEDLDDDYIPEPPPLKGVNLIYASNVNEDWERLEKLLDYANEKRADLVVLTSLFGNPLNQAEQSAYRHAFQHVNEEFNSQEAFSDIQQFIASFEKDDSKEITAVSAKKILKLIEKGKSALLDKISHFKRLKKSGLKIIIVPGPFENLDVIKSLDEEFASGYLNLATIDVKNVRILGIGGLATLDKNAPAYFQNRDYVEGTEQSHEELKELLAKNVDLFVSYTPIRYFADNAFEEQNIRKYVCDYLPGKLILTSQALGSNPLNHPVTATDATLIKGGSFGQGYFWEIRADKGGLIQKELHQIKLQVSIENIKADSLG